MLIIIKCIQYGPIDVCKDVYMHRKMYETLYTRMSIVYIQNECMNNFSISCLAAFSIFYRKHLPFIQHILYLTIY